MNAEVFAEWLRRQGHRVVRTQSSYWYDQGPRVYQAFPYHWEICPGEDELHELLRGEKAIALRYSTPVSGDCGAISYHVVLEVKDYDLSQLPKKARYDVRKGTKKFRYEPLSVQQLSSEGWAMREETLIRQGRIKAETRNGWERLTRSLGDMPGFEAWAGIDSTGKLASSLIAFTCDGCCCILYQQSRTEYLEDGANNALAYHFSVHTLSRPEITSIFYGLHSLDAPPSVDEFKFRMGYRAKPVRQRVAFHPALKPLLNPFTYLLAGGLHRLAPGNPTLSKAEGMLRFYRQGLRGLAEQDWPTPLKEQKASLVPIV
jgi:hypothetical protein